MRALRELPDVRLTYGAHRGAPELRNAMAAYLARARAVAVNAERVVICGGVSHGLVAVWNALRTRGARRVGIEDPGWRWQRLTVEHAGLDAVPVRVDGEGVIVTELAAAEVDAVVLTPAHQYPTGAAMTPQRRAALIAWAQERKALIVEDDYDAEYRFDRDPVASLQGLAPEHVAFVGSVSKTLAPSLRLGWIVPPADLVDDVETRVSRDRHYAAYARPDRFGFVHRRRCAGSSSARDAQALPDKARRPDRRAGAPLARGARRWDSGWLRISLAWLPEGLDEHETAMRARDAGVAVHELHRHCTIHTTWPPALLLGYALPTEVEIRTAVGLLAGALRPTRLASSRRR